MIGKALVAFSLLAIAGLFNGSAQAAVAVPTVPAALSNRGVSVRTHERPLLLAQDRRLEVYYDQYGRRVLVDPESGQVVTVLPDRPRDGYGYSRRYQQDGYDRDSYDDGYGDDSGYDAAPPPSDDSYYDQRRRMLERREQIIRQRQQQAIDSQNRNGYQDDGSASEGNSQQGAGVNRFPDVQSYPRPNTDTQAAPVRQAPLPAPAKHEDQQASLGGPQPPHAGNNQQPAITPSVPRTPFVEGQPALGPIASSAAVAQVQVVLDRAGASPGVIDGHFGDNVRKALDAYREITGKALNIDDPQAMKAALDASGGPAFTTYTLTNADAAGPYVASIPADYGQKAKLTRLGYSSVAEMLAERFHMDEDYLKQLNPGANFNRPGTVIKVAAVGKPVATPVARIVANKGKEEVYAYDGNGKLVAAYPSTIGSTDTPSPSGTVKVEKVVFNPTYTYNPKINFKQGDNNHILTIPPGPNNPVGDVWIALSKPTYGIHGTPEPSMIGKTNSHGCVRLTNWDAEELAKLVSPGVWVQFVN